MVEKQHEEKTFEYYRGEYVSSTGPRGGGSYKTDEVERLPPHLLGASGPNEMQERGLWRLYRGPRGPNEDPTQFRERETGGMAPRDRIWLHQVRERCESKAPNHRSCELSVVSPKTELDMHLQPNHGISSGCGPAHLDAPSRSSRNQDLSQPLHIV